MVCDKFVRKAISPKLAEQIDDMIEKIRSSFGLNITKIQASKIISWKATRYTPYLTEKNLLEILGDRE